MTEPGLLVLGAYRDNEVDARHPLSKMIRSVAEQQAPVERLELRDLSREDVDAFVGDMLGGQDDAAGLSAFLFAKTEGNPFFLHRLVANLYEGRQLAFDPRRRRWGWNSEALDEAVVSDNVVDFLISRMRQLPAAAQRLIHLAACVGRRFDTETLGVIAGGDQDLMERTLRQLVSRQFIDLEDSVGVFLHDRIQEAAERMEADVPAVRLRAGRLLLERAGEQEDPFAIVDHLVAGEHLVTDPAERLQFARLSHVAGTRAKAASALESAHGYFEAAMRFSSAEAWTSNYGFTLALHQDLAESYSTQGVPASARELFEVALEHATSDVDRAGIYSVLMGVHTNRAAYREAVEAGFDALRLFGIELPSLDDADAISQSVADEAAALDARLAGLDIADLAEAPRSHCEDDQAVMSLLANVWSPVYFVSQDLLALVVMKMVNKTLDYGRTDSAAFGYVTYGVLLSVFGDYRRSHVFGKLALQLNAVDPDPRLEGKIMNLYGLAIGPYNEHLESNLPLYRRASHLLLARGDLVYAAWAFVCILWTRFLKGDPLPAIHDEAEEDTQVMRTVGDVNLWPFFRFMKRLLRELMGTESATGAMEEDEVELQPDTLLEGWERNGFEAGVSWLHLLRTQTCVLEEKYDQALVHADEAARTLASNGGAFPLIMHAFYHALALLGARPSGERLEEVHETLAQHRDQLATWSETCPATFRHKLDLVEAEGLRVNGDAWAAAAQYERAIAGARAGGFQHEAALASHLYGRHLLAQGHTEGGRLHLQSAEGGYRSWGAHTIAGLLRARYAEVGWSEAVAPAMSADVSMTTTLHHTELALDSVLEAARVLSSEMEPVRLLHTMVTLAMESSGADRVLVFSPSGGEWRLRAVSRTGGDALHFSMDETADFDRGEAGEHRFLGAPCSSSLRSREPVVVEDVQAHRQLAATEYARRGQVRGVVVLPLTHRGQVRGLLYLESHYWAGAFGGGRLAVLEALTAHMAVSLENAFQFKGLADVQRRTAEERDRLERAVAERTKKLVEQAAELEARNAEMERFTYTVSHDLKSPIITIGGFAGLLEQDLDAGKLDEAREDIEQIRTAAKVMKQLLDDLLQLSRIGRVVNPPSDVDMNALVGSVLQMLAGPLRERGVDVVVAADLPALYGDEVRLREVVQNLVENAIKYMGDQPDPRIEVGVRDDGRGPAVFVRDNGLGIEPEYQDKVFGLFERIDQGLEGSGIGLALVRRIIEVHGGTIWVESEGRGHGSTFLFTLPPRPVDG